ncbi:MAG: alpha/beta fold hydrolase [Candidatus Omnitrophica bacterium]|nr:alpha/beta fold hydrolase [Candidatus Omnitrophota bacterium]MBI2174130.1 alpha/beta fold hydrolase [Candidatus Omnitrophota bacterium]MBI3010444.1 alpha/beta fold hydrolase [Candidatus Omnitrophota bacterium]
MWGFLALVGCILGGWGIFSTLRLLYPEHCPPPAVPTGSPSYTRHTLKASDGTPFTVWAFSPNSPKGRILLCHGYYANCYQVMEIARSLSRCGFEALLFEMRGHGERKGPCTLGIQETKDALRVLSWAHQRGTQPLPVGVMGLSMGASIVCQVAFHDSAVKAVVADSAYSRFLPVLKRSIWLQYHLPEFPWAFVTWVFVQLALGMRLSRNDPAILAPRLKQPLLAIQGGQDRRVTPMLGKEYYEKWAGPKEYWFDPDVSHVGMFTRHPQEYSRRLCLFFAENLS